MNNQDFPFTNGSQNKGASWKTIIIALIFFWPLGIYLIWNKMSVDKQSALKTGNTLFFAGLVLMVLGVITTIIGPEDQSQAVTVRIACFIVIVGGGLAMTLLGLRSKKQADRYRKYISIIINQGITTIDSIAAAFPVDYDLAVKDLQKMIDRGYFKGAYIDNTKRQIMLPDGRQADTDNLSSQTDTIQRTAVQMRAVTCKNCGANNKIAVGTAGECEYCGSPLNADN